MLVGVCFAKMGKIMLVPSGLFPDNHDPLKEKLTQLGNQMKDFLERHDIDEYAQATVYSHILQRYLSPKRKLVMVPIVVQDRGSGTTSPT